MLGTRMYSIFDRMTAGQGDQSGAVTQDLRLLSFGVGWRPRHTLKGVSSKISVHLKRVVYAR